MNAPRLRPMTAHNNLHALLFNATSAEYMVLTTQMYQLARRAVIERLTQRTFRKPAVVLDLDETILNNAAYQAWLIQSGSNYEDTTWNQWCDAAEAEAVPGALEFVLFAQNAGVTPIFITSRQNKTRTGTSLNLLKLGLISEEEHQQNVSGADAGATRLFMKGMNPVVIVRPSGEVRYGLENKYRQRIFCEQVRGFEVILSVGDNLADYAEYYGAVTDVSGGHVRGVHPGPAARRDAALQDRQLFGRDFILIPNAAYGGWLRAYEANGIGASDELAFTPEAVREPLVEPQEPFNWGNGKTVRARGPKLSVTIPLRDGCTRGDGCAPTEVSEQNLTIWKGPSASPPSPASSSITEPEGKSADATGRIDGYRQYGRDD